MVTIDYEKIHFMAHKLAKVDAKEFVKINKITNKPEDEELYKKLLKERTDFHIQKMMELKSNKEQK